MASTDFEKQVQEFKEITGADDNLAKQMLQICQGDLQMAINMHVDGGGIDIGAKDGAGPPRHNRPPPSPPLAADFPSASGSSRVGALNGEYVRPPLSPKQEVLVNYTGFGDVEVPSGPSRRGPTRSGSGGIVEPFRDLQREAQLQEEQMERGSGGIENLSSAARRATALEDLFRPPIDLMFKGTLEGAREEGRRRNKWILVNVVDPMNFPCQTLNRDVWSNNLVKDIIKGSFVFWQVYHASDEGTNYSCFYPIDAYPHVAILDPRTGERLLHWSKMDACTFAERVTDFLSHNSCPDPASPGGSDAAGTSGAAAPPLKKPKSNSTLNPSVEDMDEDEQMKAAIAASLQSEPSQTSESTQVTKANESYTKYLGPETDPKSELMFRYPDGERRVHSFPSTSQLRALTLFAHEQGFAESSHELVTNYPRRNLSELDSTLMLSEVGLFPKETIFIQLRSA